MLSNEGIDVERFFGYWVPYMVCARPEIVVALDWTSFARDGHETIVLSMLTGHGRATPLMWRTVQASTLEGNQWRYDDEWLRTLRHVMLAGVKVTVVVDRGFGNGPVIQCWSEELGFKSVLRIRGDFYVASAKGERRLASDWVGVNGRSRTLRGSTEPQGWTERYHTTPVLIETFVETPRFTGALHKASGWIRVGTTRGRGRYDRHTRRGQPKKDNWLRPLVRTRGELSTADIMLRCHRVTERKHCSRARVECRVRTAGLRRGLNPGASATLSDILAAAESARPAAPENTMENSRLGEVSPASVLGQGRLSRGDSLGRATGPGHHDMPHESCRPAVRNRQEAQPYRRQHHFSHQPNGSSSPKKHCGSSEQNSPSCYRGPGK